MSDTWSEKRVLIVLQAVLSMVLLLGVLGSVAAAKNPAETKASTVEQSAQSPPAESQALKTQTPKAEKPKVQTPARLGRMVEIALPITAKTDRLVKRFVSRVLQDAEKQQARPVLIFQFQIPDGQDEFGRGSKLGVCVDLARYLSSDALNAATTVAYIPKSIKGHAVLAALACDEIIMAPGATIGTAGIDEERIDDSVRAFYREIASRRRTVQVELALAMLDPELEVLEVETELGREFVFPEGLEELRKHRAIKSQKVLVPRGEAAQFTGLEARRLGFVSYLPESPTDAARALELPPETVEEDVLLVEGWRAVRIDLRNAITAKTVNRAMGMIEDAIRKDEANFICIWIDSPGGSPVDSKRLAEFLSELPTNQVRTVAYIPSQALSDASLIAMACDQVVMFPQAVLGGSGAHVLSDMEITSTREFLQEELSKNKSRSWSLPAAMLDPNLEVSRYTRNGVDEYFCTAELEEQPHVNEWIKGEEVTRPGKPYSADGTTAVEQRLANHTVESFASFKSLYGLENDPRLTAPGWTDYLIEVLSSPGVAALLLMIGGAALYAELHTPGMGLGAFIATVCFVLFFWSRFLGQTAEWLEVLLFVAGLGCLLVEVFVIPGFGIFGFGGGLLVFVSLVLACQRSFLPQNAYQLGQMQTSLLVVAGAGFGIFVLAYLLNLWLPRAPILNRVMLMPISGKEQELIRRREALADFEDMIGKRGVTITRLNPAGKARFGDKLVDVIADGERIDAGAEVVISEVHGSRVLVEAVEEGG
ncbi:MAG: hypothetical protein JXM70_02040 [Pirellulales bacterium]|nr:hypothetical protein [Pirellulales bacterium]